MYSAANNHRHWDKYSAALQICPYCGRYALREELRYDEYMDSIDFYSLLDEQREEQFYQAFLEANTAFIPRQFVQHHGIHLKLALSKVPFGSELKCDFLYFSKSSRDWNCVLVEIEKPGSKYFKVGTDDFHGDFLNALDQMARWRAWFSQDDNRRGFLNSLGHVQGSGWTENPTSFKYVLVHGRTAEHKNNPQRKSRISSQERDDFKILSYDSLLEGASHNPELYVGVKKSGHIKIISKIFVDEAIFSWIPTDMLRITEALRTDCFKNRHRWFHASVEEGFDYALDQRLPEIRVEADGR